MVTLFRDVRWKIAIYARDHGIPHFHIEGPGYRCSVAIMTRHVIIGSVPPQVLRQALGWAGDNQDLIMQKWLELNG